jgi:very-short-patch-repair endonuclease
VATRALADEVALLKAILIAEGRWVFQEEVRFHPTRRWRFDWASWELMLAVEWEGGTFVGGRHTSGTGYEKDLEKYNAAALMGWTVLRFTRAMLADGRAYATIAGAIDLAREAA